ncbi:MAG: hypothetical protein EP344_17585 [Bacteroidetes bacterium]|nr:MAG: hypothetical protein EP344_17585 [Bacteroidota bacterium]
MTTNPSDYLYDRLGPWPQPNQALDLWPMVVHMPKEEYRKFWWKIQLRYIRQAIFYTPRALWYALTNPGLKPVSDEELADFMCVRSYSKFMYRADKTDIERFLPGIDLGRLNPDKEYFITDLNLMRHIPSQDGMYVATTVSLFERESSDMSRFKPMAIYVESVPEEGQEPTKTLTYPEDGNAWELAKYYALLGCSYRIVFSIHSTLHFPMDALNAISKTMLPKENLVLKLLLPHLEFSLELDFTVQTSHSSPIKNHQEYPYTGVTGTADQIAGLFEDAHKGIPGREKAYPPFHFRMKPYSESRSEYYKFHMEYYYCINRFVKKVMTKLTEEDKEYLKPWAKYIAPFINKHIEVPEFASYGEDLLKHFPYDYELFSTHENEQILELLLTMLIWDLTIGHAGDHYDFGMMDMDKMPMRLRIPPPASRNAPDFNRKKLRSFWDTYRHRLEWRMFYIPTNVSLLYNVDYGFKDPDLQRFNQEFLEDLKATEQAMIDKGMRIFMPLNKIARSIQY